MLFFKVFHQAIYYDQVTQTAQSRQIHPAILQRLLIKYLRALHLLLVFFSGVILVIIAEARNIVIHVRLDLCGFHGIVEQVKVSAFCLLMYRPFVAFFAHILVLWSCICHMC